MIFRYILKKKKKADSRSEFPVTDCVYLKKTAAEYGSCKYGPVQIIQLKNKKIKKSIAGIVSKNYYNRL